MKNIALELRLSFQAGQTNPGKRYAAKNFQAYLPNNVEGKLMLKLLKLAFNKKILFEVAASADEVHGDGQLVPNGVELKSKISGR